PPISAGPVVVPLYGRQQGILGSGSRLRLVVAAGVSLRVLARSGLLRRFFAALGKRLLRGNQPNSAHCQAGKQPDRHPRMTFHGTHLTLQADTKNRRIRMQLPCSGTAVGLSVGKGTIFL